MAKHMKQDSKQPDRANRANQAYRGNLPKEAQEPAWQPKKDRAFREALAREYGVEQPPRKFQRTFARTLESLPDEMPVRHRPVYHFLRSAATVAAMLAIVFVGLLGLNTTYPQLTEALPGLGPVFIAMNGGRTEIQPPDQDSTPEPTATPMPEFQSVTVQSMSDFPGTLTIDGAWSDGKSLILDMSISPYGELYEQMEKLGEVYDTSASGCTLIPAYLKVPDVGEKEGDGIFADAMSEPDYGYDGDGYETVYSTSLEMSLDGEWFTYEGVDNSPCFYPNGQGGFSARWQVELPGPATDGISARISMPDMLFASYSPYGDHSRTCWKAGFEAEFSVPVSGGSRVFPVNARDGRVTLGTVDYAPSRVELDVTLPWLGYAGDLCQDYINPSEPLGCSATLTCMEGYQYELYDTVCPEEEMIKAGEAVEEFHVHYTFICRTDWDRTHPRDLSGPLTLTLYEFDEEVESLVVNRRVSAEFTIDLTTGRAYASENFLNEGREKADTSMTAAQHLDSLAIDGILCWSEFKREDDGTVYFQIMQRLGTISHAMLAVNAYSEGELVKQVVFNMDENMYDVGYTVSHSNYVNSSANEEYRVTDVWLNMPADEYGVVDISNIMARIEIVDYETGEVLVDDVEAAYWRNWIELFGTLQRWG